MRDNGTSFPAAQDSVHLPDVSNNRQAPFVPEMPMFPVDDRETSMSDLHLSLLNGLGVPQGRFAEARRR